MFSTSYIGFRVNFGAVGGIDLLIVCICDKGLLLNWNFNLVFWILISGLT